MFLPEDALLVSLHINMRNITARSPKLSREAAEKHDADSGSVRGVIHKFDSDDLAPLIAIVNRARTFHVANTMPWGERGERLIPATRYAYWKRELTKLQSEFMDAVEKLLRRYPVLRKDYTRRVNDLADETPFPTLAQLKESFDFSLKEEQLPNNNDLRLTHVDKKTIAELKVSLQKADEERLDEAHKDIINRLFSHVERIHEQTSKEKGRLYDSLITNLEEVVDVLPNLNLRKDPEITRLITRVRTELTSIDVAALRDDPKERAKTAKLSKSILSELKGFTNAPTKPVTRTKVAVAASEVVNDTKQAAKASMRSRLAGVKL